MLTINVHVAARAAILAGKTKVNSQSFSVDDDALAALPDALRMELALAFEAGEVVGKVPGEPPIVEPTLEALRPVLEARAARRAALVEDQKIEAARAAEQTAVSTREATARDNARSKALRAWVEKHGDDEQKARMAEGFLPEEEILEMVCEELLDLPGFRAYDPLRKGDACDCPCAGRAQITEGAPQHLDASQFAKLQQVRESAPESASVAVIEHHAHCRACSCAPISRFEARLTMPWNGWLLVRQYALT